MDKKLCENHPERKALSFCHSCGNYYCKDCLIEGPEYYYCKSKLCRAKMYNNLVDSPDIKKITSEDDGTCIFNVKTGESFYVEDDTIKSKKTLFPGLSQYYQLRFQRIYESNEKYNGGWNWAAFLFTWIWALSKGVWSIAIFILFVGFLLSIFIESGIVIIFISFAMGLFGNRIYYNVLREKHLIPQKKTDIEKEKYPAKVQEIEEQIKIKSQNLDEKVFSKNQKSTEMRTTFISARIALGLCLILGALISQFAGGKFIDNPSIATLIILVCSVFGAIKVFADSGRKTVITLTTIALVFLVLTIVASNSHIWIFDILAMVFLGTSFLMSLNFRPSS